LTSHSPSSVAEHFGRDSATISQGVGKREKGIREDKNLEGRISEGIEKMIKGRKPILI
jgi:hypothetical protein